MASLVEELESGDVKVQATALLQLLNMLATGSDASDAVTAACRVRADRGTTGQCIQMFPAPTQITRAEHR